MHESLHCEFNGQQLRADIRPCSGVGETLGTQPLYHHMPIYTRCSGGVNMANQYSHVSHKLRVLQVDLPVYPCLAGLHVARNRH